MRTRTALLAALALALGQTATRAEASEPVRDEVAAIVAQADAPPAPDITTRTTPKFVPQALPDAAQPAAVAGLPETFEIGLSTEQIILASNFSGARLVVFGALDNADGRTLRQGGYDIVVALEGPKTPLVVREKARVLGLWVNSGSETFDSAPASYSLASTRRLDDISQKKTMEQLSIGIENMRTDLGADPGIYSPNRDEYATALRRIRMDRGLYAESYGTVEFVSPTLFRADLALPADLPVGLHTARAFLFRNGVFLRERDEKLWVVKSGFETTVSNLAVRYGTLYGVFAVALAMVTGWLGRVIFKRD
jgi:uncharacterized protein (TIGR02186 family)